MPTISTGPFTSGNSFYIGIALLANFAIAGLAWAQPPPKMVINRMDNDGDGRISSAEWKKSQNVFKRIDANSDGYVTLKELKKFRKQKSAGRSNVETRDKQGSTLMAPAVESSRPHDKEGWIDVHFHIIADEGDLDGFDKAAQRTIKIMDQAGIDRIIAMPPPRPMPNFDAESIASLTKKYDSRIAIIGGGGTLNPMIQAAGHSPVVSEQIRNRFKATAEKIIASGAKGFGEIAVHHVSLSPSHGYESAPADHPLFLLLADIAARHNVPIDLHFDPIPKDVKTPRGLTSPKNPRVLKENITAFERLLAHNRATKFVWAHAGSDPVGWYTPKLVRKMLDKHPNLYFSIRAVNHPDTDPVWHPKTGINNSWVRVFKKYPDRFVLGTDSFVVSQDFSGVAYAPLEFEKRTPIQRDGAAELLSSLRDNIARKIGRDNAIRIYRLNE